MTLAWRPALLITMGAGVVIVVAMVDPVPQDPLYYFFADQRPIASIPNFMDVMSNLPFLLVGLWGWRVIAKGGETLAPETRPAWFIFFFGIALTAFGSGYFHLAPNNDTVVWDRLAMTIGFMSLVSIIVAEYFSPLLGKRLLFPLLLAGIASVAYWAYTESLGAGDLRPFAIVQFLPILLIPLIIILYNSRSELGRYLWWMIGFYVAAKISEQLDRQLYDAGHFVSGHTLKHLLASLAPASLVFALAQRQARGFPR